MTDAINLSENQMKNLNQKGRTTIWVDGELILINAPRDDE